MTLSNEDLALVIAGLLAINEDGDVHYLDEFRYLHKEHGPAVIELDGTLRWYQHGKYHRDGGPAIIFPDGYKAWFQNGIRHREDGPAIIYSNGTNSYWLNGKQVDPF